MRMSLPQKKEEESAQLYDVDAPKKPTNLSLNADLLKKAKALGLNLSQICERSLIEALRIERQSRWLKENKKATEDYNDRIIFSGLFA